MRNVHTLGIAQKAFRKHKQVHGHYDHYTGVLTLHGFARLASLTGDPALLEEVMTEMAPYVSESRDFPGNFPNYLIGGNATAWMLFQGWMPEAECIVRKHADMIVRESPRTPEGLLCHPARPGENVIWIDVAFAVSPFLVFAGLALREEAWVEEGIQQTVSLIHALRVEETGLLNQALNVKGPGHRTRDHWSRGNGWGAFALAEIVTNLPDGHPRKAEVCALFRDHVRACAAFQDADGLWHQEMTEPVNSYVETSGSGLLLYALGAGLEAGLIDPGERERFERGVRGLRRYVTADGDVFHTVCGCLSPGMGGKEAYMARPPVLNDPHAFGPVIFAMGQAHFLGLETL